MEKKDILVNERFNDLMNKCSAFSDNEKRLIQKSFELARASAGDALRENGDPFIFHAIAVARILIDEMGLMAPTIIALFLHEAYRKSGMAVKNIENEYGKDIAVIVNGLNKISEIDIKTTSLQVEKFRKLIVSLSTDPRVILIKLADRLEVMRSLSFFPKSKQAKKATETLLLYAPMAHQLGLYNLKSELEDTSLRYTEPDDYRTIITKLKTSKDERDKFIRKFVAPIEAELKKQGIKYEIKSRTKSVYSIWRKMQQQKVNFEGVYDIFAIRVILDTPIEREKEDCWEVYSIVTNLYKPNTNRLRDWITVPKSTGYESLHITVDTNDERTVEVQIRTRRMDDIAENGAAAHWKYKGVKQLESVQSWLDTVRSLLTSPSENFNNSDDFQQIKLNEIFVFTPNGDLRQLPAGASVLDFAFDIHTNIGVRCVGARINGKNTTIKEKLKTGDVVEIQTSKNQSPKPDWLNYVITNKARARIRQKLREDETHLAGMGKEMLERRLKNWKLPLNDDILAVLLKHYRLRVITDLYAQIAAEKIDLAEIKDILSPSKTELKTSDEPTLNQAKQHTNKPVEKTSSNDYLIIDDKLSNVAYKFAKCCNPIFGDEIFGFVTIKDGIKIHRANCPNALRLMEKYDYRVINVKWVDKDDRKSFQTSIKITGYEEPGLASRISEVAEKAAGVSVRSLNMNTNKGLFEARLQIYVSDKPQLDMLLYRLQQIKGIEKVVRLSS